MMIHDRSFTILKNEAVEKLANTIKPSTVVVIIPGIEDVRSNAIDTAIDSKKLKTNAKKTDKLKLKDSDSLTNKKNKSPIRKDTPKSEIKEVKKTKKNKEKTT
jgi:hypothetical protein